MKRISLLVTLLIIAVATWAAKALSIPIIVTQPDGTELTVFNHGDEDLHWYTTTDGVILYHSGSYFYIAAIDDNGNITSTSQLAHESGQRNATEQELIAQQNKEKFYSSIVPTSLKAAMKREPLNSTSGPSYFPHTGSPKAIVILVNFADTSFIVSGPQKVFNEYLNGETLTDYGHGEALNYGSVRQYFKDMSFGNFTPQFDVYGPYNLSQKMAYYGANSGSTEDIHFASIISDACKLADADVNFANYDADGDGYADLVYIIYAGYGESNGASSNTIWPKSGAIESGTYDGKKVSRYGLNSELNMFPAYYSKSFPKINGIGLFCHEFSHTLGMPDIYPTSTSAQVNNQEMEYWDVMDGGEYVHHGYCPAPYTAWERETIGWYKLDTLSVSKKDIVISPVSDGGKAYRFLNDQNKSEYMILENIQKTGWSSYLPGHGLLVYHVKWPSTTVSMSDHPNNIAGKPGMAIVPADGLLLSSYIATSMSEYITAQGGDVFPGTSNITALNDTMNLPNFVWYNTDNTTRKVNLALNNITEAATGITFDYIDDFATGIKDITIYSEDNIDDRIYTIDGRYVGKDKEALPKGIYIRNNRKFVVK